MNKIAQFARISYSTAATRLLGFMKRRLEDMEDSDMHRSHCVRKYSFAIAMAHCLPVRAILSSCATIVDKNTCAKAPERHIVCIYFERRKLQRAYLGDFANNRAKTIWVTNMQYDLTVFHTYTPSSHIRHNDLPLMQYQ